MNSRVLDSVTFRCGHCEKKIKAGTGLCGSRVGCPHCRKFVDVPIATSGVSKNPAAIAPKTLIAEPEKKTQPFAFAEFVLMFFGGAVCPLAAILGFPMIERIGVVAGVAMISGAVISGFCAFAGVVLIAIARDVSRIANRNDGSI